MIAVAQRRKSIGRLRRGRHREVINGPLRHWFRGRRGSIEDKRTRYGIAQDVTGFALSVQNVDRNEDEADLRAGDEEIDVLRPVWQIHREPVACRQTASQELSRQPIASGVDLAKRHGLARPFERRPIAAAFERERKEAWQRHVQCSRAVVPAAMIPGRAVRGNDRVPAGLVYTRTFPRRIATPASVRARRTLMRRSILLAVLLLSPLHAQQTTSSTPGLLIRGGTVYDGTGQPGLRADVRTRGDLIVEIGASLPVGAGERVVDASGLAVAPGFIDVHNHSDDALGADTGAAPLLRQGITTAAGGSGRLERPARRVVHGSHRRAAPGNQSGHERRPWHCAPGGAWRGLQASCDRGRDCRDEGARRARHARRRDSVSRAASNTTLGSMPRPTSSSPSQKSRLGSAGSTAATCAMKRTSS